MDIRYTPEQLAFRDSVRAFLKEAVPATVRDKTQQCLPLSKAEREQWQRSLFAQGWGAPSWAVEFGGTGWDAVQRHIFEEECAAFGAPEQLPFGLKMVAPVIQRYGSKEQQERFLPRILSGQDWWCQGYSEPGAGSDLASLKTTAVRDGDDYIVNGQKTWTTLAQHADWIFCLVRTNPEVRKQEGISFLLIDMKTPGITVRPIIMLDDGHEVNEVWLENVRVPAANLIGEENKGWTYAKFLLGHERTNIARVGRSKAALQLVKEAAARQTGNDGLPLLQDARFRDRLAQVEMDLMALEITNLKLISQEGSSHAPGPEASILKVKGSEIQQAITALASQVAGPYAAAHILPDDQVHELSSAFPQAQEHMTAQYFNYRKTTIYGGSNEVQKGIICRMILGL
ncbi:acyl-CoA dehydrogenase [Advenella kashmirensis WT001]|uniref:Acyl-CoA dehydrogenase n=1 Tax=Advenella kashmirensis (strain DSM 17095 / LMG 22695 / WT001) TaxID=1036672 RepID=I3UEF8_ADVKW|nr:acyl-CoA dehydrogenase family protein [Advenella kashmirensis]AFK63396.1 acyl-CoA dehydrogenase [Advenella kashmirensis WT001]